jgi:hypothetical protein
VQWQYKTILVGFQKDGLLGDKYIDEEETEAVLNAEGRYGWELVTATLVPEGMLFFCKKELLPGEEPESMAEEEAEAEEDEEEPPEDDGSGLGSIKIF